MDTYNTTTTLLLWSYELYVCELMSMKRGIEFIELKGKFNDLKLTKILKANQKLAKENKILKEQVINLQRSMERGQ